MEYTSTLYTNSYCNFINSKHLQCIKLHNTINLQRFELLYLVFTVNQNYYESIRGKRILFYDLTHHALFKTKYANSEVGISWVNYFYYIIYKLFTLTDELRNYYLIKLSWTFRLSVNAFRQNKHVHTKHVSLMWNDVTTLNALGKAHCFPK